MECVFREVHDPEMIKWPGLDAKPTLSISLVFVLCHGVVFTIEMLHAVLIRDQLFKGWITLFTR